VKATFRPLLWSSPSTPDHKRRSRYTFKATWSSTLQLLDRELEYLKAADLVIEADFREQELRLDGMPRGNARQPIHPGVRVAFDSKHGPLIYATDSCAFWQHNVRSIALGLEALRAVDRYGVTKRGEQYTGWRAIGSGVAMPAQAPMNPDAAAALIGQLALWDRPPRIWDPDDIKRAYRAAARRHHPDAGGQRADWDRLEAAMKVLGGGRP
jgi:hypothetical protein